MMACLSYDRVFKPAHPAHFPRTHLRRSQSLFGTSENPGYKRTSTFAGQVRYEVYNNYDDDLAYDKNSNLPIIEYHYTTKPNFCPEIFNKFSGQSRATVSWRGERLW